MGVQKLTDTDIPVEKKKKALWFSLGTTLLLCAVGMALADTEGPNDSALGDNSQLLSLLREDRASMLRSDMMRSLGFIALAAALIFYYIKGSLKAPIMVLGIALLSLVDTWQVCLRTLPSSKYVSAKNAIAPPQPEEFDLQIKADPDPHYRVLDLARGSITGNATTSYFHKSLSGYHAAKLQRFQEVVDRYLSKDLGRNLHIVGMLNGKYIVTDKGQVFLNPEACGNAWFVDHVQVLPNGDAELDALGTLNPKDSAVVQQSYAAELQGLNIRRDSADYIRLTNYHPDRMEYEYSAKSEQFAVFSEMWYPPAKGWKCYLNGQPAPDFIKADYLLRGMRLPAGEKQKLEMRFEPRSFVLGEKVALAASLVTFLLCLAALYFWFKGGLKLSDAVRLPSEEAKVGAEPQKGGKRK
jgi:hypothetical protein